MGFLPIIVALLGFLLLWGIVNYYSIKQRRNEVKLAISEVFEASERRNEALQLLIDADRRDKNQKEILHYIGKQLDRRKEGEVGISDKLRQENKVSDLIMDIPPQEEAPAYQTQFDEVQKANKGYQMTARLFRNRSADYNELISNYPSKLVARISGQKPIP